MAVIYSFQIYLYCKSLVLHIWLNGSLYLLNLKTRFLRLQQLNGKIMNHVLQLTASP